ncbi:MAG: hypothetical protein JO112_09595 [Planctomycetes bacterium]|nr:hypothetical protein [Planctomycetota bacterium]
MTFKTASKCHWLGIAGTLAGFLACGPAPAASPWRGFRGCADIPPGAIPPPAGVHVRAWEEAQTTLARADRFVIYLNEWFMGGQTLGPYGQYHLQQILQGYSAVPYLVVIQPNLDRDDLNEVHRRVIVQALLDHGYQDAPSRVVVAFPPTEGISGEEGSRIYVRMLSTGTQGGGTQGGVGAYGGGVGSFGGGLGGGLGLGGLGGVGGGFGR